uniref:DEP domain-containing protein n=1 Tax=Rhodosorus marinus TaxID=101924 RepID=A0A7S3A396_9RHOD|mmetsp:Transcript_41524/g.163405  ORF Transcript_41524/g.163405 Transcript_41524/m.163405 type:complete len:666 (+) Transcript_41524:151-2148(+)
MSSDSVDSGIGIDEIVSAFKTSVVVKDRKHMLKTYKKCFVGSEAVDVLVREDIVSNRKDAVAVGQLMLDQGIFHHVLREHQFEDAKLFYQFTEGHGEKVTRDGSKVSWSDFIKPVTKETDESLQPAMPASAATPEIDFNISEQLAPLDEHNLRLLDSVHPSAWQDPKAKPKYHMVVIGAGTGGLVTAAGSAGVGARVAMIEKNLLGGDCLNYGCVPSKALISAAKAYHSVTNQKGLTEMGITVEGATIDFGKVMERLRRLRADIAHNDSAERFASKLGVDVYLGHAKFLDKNTVEVNGQKLTFARCTIATGGSPRLPDVSGIKELFEAYHKKEEGAPTIVTNESIFNLTELPPRFAAIGNGAIGLEIAQSMTRFGSETTVFGRGGRIMAKEDEDIAKILQDQMASEGTNFELGVEKYVSLKKTGRTNGSYPEMEMEVLLKGGQSKTFLFDALLVAAGRTPNVGNLDLEKAAVKYDKKEGILVNDRLETSSKGIFAVGDCCTAYKFTHVADFMARIVIRNSLFFGKDKFSKLIIPWSTYTEPEVAHVGLYEQDIAKKGQVVTVQKDFADNDRAILEGETVGFVRIHTLKGSDKILGASIIGANAGNLISELTLAMNAGYGLGSVASVIHPYPTQAEAIRAAGDLLNKNRLTPTVRAVLRQVLKFQN